MTTLQRLRRSTFVAYATLAVILGPLVPHAALAQEMTDPDINAASDVTEGQTSLGMPETSPGAPVGALASASVDPATGTLRASIPFALPRARGGDQPTLSLSYSSVGGWGAGGQGWSLDTPSIERKNLSGPPQFANDAFEGGSINPATQDRFVYAGHELVPVCFVPTTVANCTQADSETLPSWVTTGWHYYRLQNEGSSTHLRFFWSIDHLTWVVQQPDGSTLELGVPRDTPTDLGGVDQDYLTKAAFRWNLTRQYDAQRVTSSPSQPSNLIKYEWSHSAGSDNRSALTDVYDTPPMGVTSLDDSMFAHHAHLRYVRGRTSQATAESPVWRAPVPVTLVGVDVTSRTFNDNGPREQVRRYSLAYDATSRLASVQLEGWCPPPATDPLEGPSWTLPDESSTGPVCPTLPKTTFGYSQVGGPRISPVSVTVPASGATTSESDSMLPTLADINSDGMPDIVVGTGKGDEKAYFNSAGTTLNDWSVSGSASNPIVRSLLTPASESYNTGAFDTSGALGVLWFSGLPEDTSHVTSRPMTLYTPSVASTGSWSWNATALPALPWALEMVPPPSGVGITITETQAYNGICQEIYGEAKYLDTDIDGDGLSDLVGEVSFSTNADCDGGVAMLPPPNGNGRITPFGLNTRFTRESASGALTPFARPADWTPNGSVGGVLQGTTLFGTYDKDIGLVPNGHVELADVNGDGLVDWINPYLPGAPSEPNIGESQLVVWYGNGDGTFGPCATPGAPQACTSSATASAQIIPLPGIDVTYASVHDVDGDGLADLIVPNDQGFDVYVNVAGTGFSQSPVYVNVLGALGWTHAATPPGSVVYLFADMDGSGVDDIVLFNNAPSGTLLPTGSPAPVGYVNFVGGPRPGLLSTIATSPGTTTNVSYEDLPALARAARATTGNSSMDPWNAGGPWASQSPQSLHVVTQLTTSDPNGASAAKITTYSYRDPVFDARDRSFIGFTSVVTTAVGDPTEPTSHHATTFYQGHCNASSPCQASVDYMAEALRGLPVLENVYDDTNHHLSTTHHTFDVSAQLQGMDGRYVYQVYETATDTFLYDSSVAAMPSTPTTLSGVTNSREAIVASETFSTSPTATHLHVETNIVSKNPGRYVATSDYGRVDANGNSLDGIVVSATSQAPAPLDTVDHWLWRPSSDVYEGEVDAAPSGTPRAIAYSYDARGNVLTETTTLTGTLPLVRSHETGAQVAGAPAGRSVNGAVTLKTWTYDPAGSGNVKRTQQPGSGRCVDYAYDPAFAQMVTSQSVWTGGCGSKPLLTSYPSYERGIERPLVETSPDGQTTIFTYDAFGRPASVARPDPTTYGATGAPDVFFYYDDTDSPRSINTQIVSGGKVVVQSWIGFDGFGRTLTTASPADVKAGDTGNWVVSSVSRWNAKGHVTASYPPYFQDAATGPVYYPTPSGPARTAQYDAFGHLVQAFDLDGTQTLQRTFHAVSADLQDAEQISPTSAHAGNKTTLTSEGHGRTVRRDATGNGGTESVAFTYLPTGEVSTITRSGTDATHASVSSQRWMLYDSLGRMVFNAEPNTSTGFTTNQAAASSVKAWTYAYNDAGDLVGTSDARGCGENLAYDPSGRLLWEDYSPCKAYQPAYTTPQANGTGAEVFYEYDGASSILQTSRLTDVLDRAVHTHYEYDARDRITAVQRNLAVPNGAASASARYAPHTFEVDFAYDDYDRVIAQTTGADSDIPDLMGATAVSVGEVTSKSAVQLHYSARGVVDAIDGSYGALIRSSTFDADGLPLATTWGDAASTGATYAYDARRRLSEAKIARSAPALWSQASGSYTPPPLTPPSTLQLVLADDVLPSATPGSAGAGYDAVNNPTTINDARNPEEWPATAQPVNRTIAYDDFYRVKSTAYAYAGPNTYASPDPAPSASVSPVPRVELSPMSRVGRETFDYDPLGNLRSSGDDEGLFYDRSLGQITPGSPTALDQLQSAAQWTGASTGNLFAYYDEAGNVVGMTVYRDGACAKGSDCSQVYRYQWDEVGHLSDATRYDVPTPQPIERISPPHFSYYRPDQWVYPAVPSQAPAADICFRYDGKGQRVLRSYGGCTSATSYSAEIFSSLRLNHTTFGANAAGDYDRDESTEAVYLVAGGASLGRVVYSGSDPVVGGTSHQAPGGTHVFFEMTDSLGSTSITVDQATGELVERATYTSYGQVESDYRPDRWSNFREDYKFTGKEEDLELGLSYFGARYYSSNLGRWMSADPVTIHQAGGDLNPYAYVHGRTFAAVDPSGLEDPSDATSAVPDASDDDEDGDAPDNPDAVPESDGPGSGSAMTPAGVHLKATLDDGTTIECIGAECDNPRVVQKAALGPADAPVFTPPNVGQPPPPPPPQDQTPGGWGNSPSVRDAAVVGVGFVFGAGQGAIPLAMALRPAPSLAKHNSFQIAQAVGQVLGGAFGYINGWSKVTLGAGVGGGSGGVLAGAGAAVAAVGYAQQANGIAAIGIGLTTLMNKILGMGGRGGGRGGSSATGSGESKMLGSKGTQMTSKTIWKGGDGMRIDVENPNPGQRPGQIHFQQGDAKYLYDPASNSFAGAPRAVNNLLETSDVQNAIAKGLRFLGE